MEHEHKGKAIASLVLGIVSCVGSVAYLPGWIIGIVCGILAIIFGAQTKKGKQRGIAIAGFVLGIVGTSLCGITIVGALVIFRFFL